LMCAMFAQLMSDWKHCEDQQKKDCFLFILKKQFH